MILQLLYLDESGVPNLHETQTTHFALAGIAIPARTWAQKRDQMKQLVGRYGISQAEIHVAWLLGSYPEQRRVPAFESQAWPARRLEVEKVRRAVLAAIKAAGRKPSKALRKKHRATAPYIHLTLPERQQLVADIADLVAGWDDAVLFGEVADKRVPQLKVDGSAYEQDEAAYEQVVTRFEAWLARSEAEGVVAYDLNEAIVERFISLTARFQDVGGMWRRLDHIAGHPFFVGSHTSEMIQIADVIAYALRRCAEKGEDALLERLLPRFDWLDGDLVGLRHFRGAQVCACLICRQPRRPRRGRRPTYQQRDRRPASSN